MQRRRSLAVLVLMVVLAVAPSLALAASVCAPRCCPAMTADPSGSSEIQTIPDAAGRADRAAGDCRAAFANRSCCAETPIPGLLASPAAPEVPAPAFRLLLLAPVPSMALLAPERRADARLASRTSPLRRSVVLLI